MQLIFLSTLERRQDEHTATAQVSITEQQGSWRVLWNESGIDGRSQQDCWYEGINWREMLQAYRQGLQVKRIEGYFPLVDTNLQFSFDLGKQRNALMLQYYAEEHHSEELFEELRKWRRQQASKEGKSAFFIATNRMLHMVSTYLPRTVDELQAIPGFGQRKTEAYGKELLEIAGKLERVTSFPLDWVIAQIQEPAFEAWLLLQQRSREQQDQQKEFQRRKVLECIAAGFSLSELENEVGLKRLELVRLVEELERDGYDTEPLLASELAGLSAEELAAVNSLFMKHGSRLLKPVLTDLYSEDELKGKDLTSLYEKLRLQRIRFRRETPAASLSGGADGEQAAG
ncbi:MAG: hypothetical protein K0R57_3188 [Paenibacillaceae bacterium]|jgi:hypothetical protein|nr:hypothetical protein [Paenibacillaceae bacterium]